MRGNLSRASTPQPSPLLGLSAETQEAFQLRYYPGFEDGFPQKPSVGFPILSPYGRKRAYGYLHVQSGNYTYRPSDYEEEGINYDVYNVTGAVGAESRQLGLVVVERALEVWRFYEAGIPNVVSLFGSWLITGTQMEWLLYGSQPTRKLLLVIRPSRSLEMLRSQLESTAYLRLAYPRTGDLDSLPIEALRKLVLS